MKNHDNNFLAFVNLFCDEYLTYLLALVGKLTLLLIVSTLDLQAIDKALINYFSGYSGSEVVCYENKSSRGIEGGECELQFDESFIGAFAWLASSIILASLRYFDDN